MKEIIRSSRKRFRKMFVYLLETNEKSRFYSSSDSPPLSSSEPSSSISFSLPPDSSSSCCPNQDANVYTTSMDGHKYKLAHKRVGINRWSVTESAQKEQLIKILEEYVIQLKREMVQEVTENYPIVASGS
jgi:hypothetical protein